MFICTAIHSYEPEQGAYDSWKSWNFIDAPGKFNCQLNYDNMPVNEPNVVTSLNPRKCHLTIFLCSFIHNVVHN